MKSARAVEIDRVIRKHFCINIYPTIHHDGLEQYRILAFEGEQIRDLFKSLDRVGDSEVLLKRKLDNGVALDVFPISLSNMLSDLTQKQLQALVVALDAGLQGT